MERKNRHELLGEYSQFGMSSSCLETKTDIGGVSRANLHSNPACGVRPALHRNCFACKNSRIGVTLCVDSEYMIRSMITHRNLEITFKKQVLSFAPGTVTVEARYEYFDFETVIYAINQD